MRPCSPGLTWLTQGAVIGLAGGLAEVLVVGAYSRVAGVDASAVANAIATAVRIDAGSAATGLFVHMALSAALGIVLLAVANGSGLPRVGSAPLTCAMSLLPLGAIWGMNFFVVLPILSSAFVHLLPYAITLASKLMFAGAAVLTLLRFRSARPCAQRHPALRGSTVTAGLRHAA